MTYFTGDDIVLRFTVSDDGVAFPPLSTSLQVLLPDGSWRDLGASEIEGNKITHVVPNAVTSLDGDYMALFKMTFAGDLIRQHKMLITVKDALVWM